MGKKCGIYCIENTVNHKKYIGQTIDIRRRWSEHVLRLNKGEHCNTYLQRAWDKYTAEVFNFTLLEECAESDLDEREKYYIEYYQTMADQWGYNLTGGGDSRSGHHRAVIDYRTQEIYPSLAMIAKVAKVAKQTVGLWCKERRNYMYYDEWQLLSPQEQKEVQSFDWLVETHKRRIDSHHKKTTVPFVRYDRQHERVYCPELNEYFDGIQEAHKKYGVCYSSISGCLRGRYKTAGKHPVTGEKLTWVKVMKE